LKKTTVQQDVLPIAPEEALHDYYICCLSREVSLTIRREVLTGKAKFGVSDDGKELFQVAMAKAFRKGDFRSDYYRGHTLLLSLELATPEDLFAQLYADADNDPFSGGRQMNNHHATPLITTEGDWLNHRERHNLSSDISTTAGQMARGIGLAMASKKYRDRPDLDAEKFSDNGQEVVFCCIGDASTSEGAFWETMNAAGVHQLPLVTTVADDGYGISVPREVQTTKDSISEALAGMEATSGTNGMGIYKVKGWDYPALCEAYEQSASQARLNHRPALVHVKELTQPQGHSTSGSHERYKSKARLKWEAEHDCNRKFKLWLLKEGVANEQELEDLEQKAQKAVKQARSRAWKRYNEPIQQVWKTLKADFAQLATDAGTARARRIEEALKALINPVRADIVKLVRQMLFATRQLDTPDRQRLQAFLEEVNHTMEQRYHTHLYSQTDRAALKVPVNPPVYSDDAPLLNGYEILNQFFDQAMSSRPELFAFGEDVGKIGDVNQGFAGLQEKHGAERIFDTGIREWTIMGYALGMAMRGLRPIAEIQYLDYLIYGLSPLSDDLATLRYRSNSIQAAPAIIRTRGHRLEGIWHSGSPIGVLLGALRGIHLLVPRNMVQAAGFYNTLLQSDDPGLIIECLNGYRLKERLPDNLSTFTVPIGVPEILREGEDVTLLTYGSCVRVAEAACDQLRDEGISVELVDAQSLLPFDLENLVVASLQKTNRLVVLDEDVPGGASAYLLQQVLEKQGGYRWLDSKPLTITATDHRPPYGTDGDYYSKPNPEDVFERILEMMQEADPVRYA
jgi:pyruvate/2-oxoglutarate/acetoin dehydrogenase E1 component/TPP-dependent pyruvate/acetoin dehydrogenase alpha subunit